jgi:hypothetical protein
MNVERYFCQYIPKQKMLSISTLNSQAGIDAMPANIFP